MSGRRAECRGAGPAHVLTRPAAFIAVGVAFVARRTGSCVACEFAVSSLTELRLAVIYGSWTHCVAFTQRPAAIQKMPVYTPASTAVVQFTCDAEQTWTVPAISGTAVGWITLCDLGFDLGSRASAHRMLNSLHSLYRSQIYSKSKIAYRRSSAYAEGPRNAQQIRNIALEKACNTGMTFTQGHYNR